MFKFDNNLSILNRTGLFNSTYFLKYFLLVFFILIFSLSILKISYGTCNPIPSNIIIYSGNSQVGSFDYNYIKNNFVYIRKNLTKYPIRIKFIFNVSKGCFQNKTDVKMKLFEQGLKIDASSYTYNEKKNQSIFEFKFREELILPGSFISSYFITDKARNSFNDEIKFAIDEESPRFDNINFEPKLLLVKPMTNVSYSFRVIDEKSGLDFVSMSGPENQIFNFENRENSFEFSGSFNATTTTELTITAKDRDGNLANLNKRIVVDSESPRILNIEDYKYEESRGRHYVSISVKVLDLSYNFTEQPPDIYGNFSFLNPSLKHVVPNSCERIDELKYICKFKKILITNLQKSKVVPILFVTKDILGNEGITTFQKKIKYDGKGPEILEFYTLNSLNEKNIFNSYDSNVRVFLKFKDESLRTKDDIRLYPSFDGLERFSIPKCNVSENGIETCIWNLSSAVQKYQGIEQANITFKISLLDKYNNPSKKKINLTIYNKKPIITKIWFEENSDVKDGIISSGEKVTFKMFVIADKVKFDKEHIFGDFSNIDFDDGSEHKFSSCSYYNETTIECDFNGIEVENGYMKRNVTFYFKDLTGSTAVKNYTVEIFAINDEVFSSFRIKDLVILNPLDRFMIENSGATAWFKGQIEKIGKENEKIHIINYYLKECNDSEMNPILLGERKLYPEDVVRSLNPNEDADKNFIIKSEVRTHPNPNDLVTKNMTCSMSILKRDNKSIYRPEIVKFHLIYEFRTLPLQSSLKAEASKILNMIDESRMYGKWFDTTYKIYSFFNNICNVISQVTNVLTIVSNAILDLQILLGNTPAKPIVNGAGSAAHGTQSIVSELFTGDKSPVKLICDFVTCRNGGILGSIIKESFPELKEFDKKISTFEEICSTEIKEKKNKVEKINGDYGQTKTC